MLPWQRNLGLFIVKIVFDKKRRLIKMKKILSLVLVVLLVATVFAGCGKKDTASVPEKTEKEETFEGTNIRIGGLKGPTSMGLVKLLDDAENGKTVNTYDFTMAAAADELTPKLIQGELDILAVPANLGSVLYNKTNGAVKMLAVNMLGAVYIAEKGGNTINSLADLKGKTIYATGKGTTPEYVLAYLLKQNGLDITKDVTMEWKSEPTETVATIKTMDNAVAMLPQPFITVATTQVPDLKIALDLNAEWDKLDNGSKFVTAGLVVRSEFAKENPNAIKAFMKEYANSTKFVKENVSEGAALIEKYDIVKAQIAEKALPQCNIVCMKGKEMKDAVTGYLNVLFEQNPQSVGGKLPADDFFLMYE